MSGIAGIFHLDDQPVDLRLLERMTGRMAHALLFSEEKFPVTGFDIDSDKVKTLATGGSYIYRIPQTDIAAARAHGFSATSDYSRVATMDAIIICVPTPLTESREPDLQFITSTAEAIAPHLRRRQLPAPSTATARR